MLFKKDFLQIAAFVLFQNSREELIFILSQRPFLVLSCQFIITFPNLLDTLFFKGCLDLNSNIKPGRLRARERHIVWSYVSTWLLPVILAISICISSVTLFLSVTFESDFWTHSIDVYSYTFYNTYTPIQ